MSEYMAKEIVPLLESLLQTKPTMKKEEQEQIYDWLTRMPNFSEDRTQEIKTALAKKKSSGLL